MLISPTSQPSPTGDQTQNPELCRSTSYQSSNRGRFNKIYLVFLLKYRSQKVLNNIFFFIACSIKTSGFLPRNILKKWTLYPLRIFEAFATNMNCMVHVFGWECCLTTAISFLRFVRGSFVEWWQLCLMWRTKKSQFGLSCTRTRLVIRDMIAKNYNKR